MNLYLGYFAAEENVEGDNPPIGIILTRGKDQLYLPNEDELRQELNHIWLAIGDQ